MKYPKEIFDVVRNQTLYIVNGLSKATAEDKNEPLKFYHKSFARFPVTIINQERKAVSANLSPFDVPDMAERSRFAYWKDMELSMSSSSKNESPAYTTRIVSGTLKGKTPAEALLDMENGVALLNNQLQFLRNNLQRYPKNQTQITAIEDALRLYSEGRLNKESVLKSFRLYDTGGPRPNRYKRRQDGKSPVYEMSIGWNFGTDYPVNITIMTYFAPVIENPDKTILVQKKAADSFVKNSMSLTAKEWFKALYFMQANMRVFEDMIGPECYETATNAEKENMASWKNNNSNVVPMPNQNNYQNQGNYQDYGGYPSQGYDQSYPDNYYYPNAY